MFQRRNLLSGARKRGSGERGYKDQAFVERGTMKGIRNETVKFPAEKNLEGDDTLLLQTLVFVLRYISNPTPFFVRPPVPGSCDAVLQILLALKRASCLTSNVNAPPLPQPPLFPVTGEPPSSWREPPSSWRWSSRCRPRAMAPCRTCSPAPHGRRRETATVLLMLLYPVLWSFVVAALFVVKRQPSTK